MSHLRGSCSPCAREAEKDWVVVQTHWAGEKKVEILEVHEFDSARKYMSVALRVGEQIKLLVKGANRVVYDILAKDEYERVVNDLSGRIHRLSAEGLRVLVWAERPLSEVEYEKWKRKHTKEVSQVNNERYRSIRRCHF